jgi:hypothetical protein
MTAASDFVAALEQTRHRRPGAPSTRELADLAEALGDADGMEIGKMLARRIDAREALGLVHPLLGFVHPDALAEVANAARRRIEAGGDREPGTLDAICLIALQAPAVLAPHREWLATVPDLEHLADREEDAREIPAAPGPIHVVPPIGHVRLCADVPTPTWLASRGRAVGTARIGGPGEKACAICGKTLHRLLDLDPVPERLGLSLARLAIDSCLSCLGWEEEQLWFRHDDGGRAAPLDDGDGTHEPQFPATPLRPAAALLVDFGARYARQDWGTSNGCENLHRIGGPPTWVQDVDRRDCRTCGEGMRHLLQLDSELPNEGGSGFLFGSGGVAYVQWCDACRVSVQFWQCT